jgi:hypothetical protein
MWLSCHTVQASIKFRSERRSPYPNLRLCQTSSNSANMVRPMFDQCAKCMGSTSKWKQFETIIPQAPRAPGPAFLTDRLSGCLRQCPWASAWCRRWATGSTGYYRLLCYHRALSLLCTFVYVCPFLSLSCWDLHLVQVSVHQNSSKIWSVHSSLCFLYLLVNSCPLCVCVWRAGREIGWWLNFYQCRALLWEGQHLYCW